jgi:hypothetical protein
MRIVLILMVLIASCNSGNTKEKIVERQQEIKHAIEQTQMVPADDTLLTDQAILERKWRDIKRQIKKDSLQRIFDSLEIELKKY